MYVSHSCKKASALKNLSQDKKKHEVVLFLSSSYSCQVDEWSHKNKTLIIAIVLGERVSLCGRVKEINLVVSFSFLYK